MGHIREAAATAQAMAHGDLAARCERRAAGVIRDLQDSLHDMSGALGEGVQQVQQSFLELALQTVEVLERRGSRGHGHRTCTYAMLLAQRLGLTSQECRDLQTAAQLHDLGEIFEPPTKQDGSRDDAGLVKRLRRIPQRGAELIQGFSHLSRVAEIVRHHRECFDGTGFPHGLQGERIPLGARILGIADAFDQLTTLCPAGGKPHKWPEALDALRADRGETFDPWLVDLFEEEIRKHPGVVEEASTVMISTAGVVPYKALHVDREHAMLEETSIAWEDEDFGPAELEVYDEGHSGGESR
jgi:response regulator RpfG family c-di-GMP phosphodiesterase